MKVVRMAVKPWWSCEWARVICGGGCLRVDVVRQRKLQVHGLSKIDDGGGDESCCEVKKAKKVIMGWWSRVMGMDLNLKLGVIGSWNHGLQLQWRNDWQARKQSNLQVKKEKKQSQTNKQKKFKLK
jgi:hypothetical protein